jgi:hypothetical protein
MAQTNMMITPLAEEVIKSEKRILEDKGKKVNKHQVINHIIESHGLKKSN